MKHQKQGRKFSRIRKQRRALIKSLIDNLIIRERIVTTEAKAKELKSIADKIIGKFEREWKGNKANAIRQISKFVSEKSAKKISGDFAKKFEGRKSGYTRVVKIGRRNGDSAKMAIIEFV